MDSRLHLHPLNHQRDENAVNLTAPLKSLHQRHKSTSALASTFAQPLKATNLQPFAKRTAFADVSNLRNANNQEDHGAKPKTTLLDVKPIRPAQKDLLPLQSVEANASKPKTLLRPAQRSLPSASQKALPAPPVNSITNAAPHQVNVSNVEQVPVRKTIVKRHTTIFRETPNVTSVAPAITELKTFASSTIPLPSSLSKPTISESQEPVITSSYDHVSSPVELIEQPVTTAPQQVFSLASTLHQPSSLAVVDTLAPLRSLVEFEALYVNQDIVEPELYLPALETQLPSLDVPSLDEKAMPTSATEPAEEYWEEEEEEEFFDAEGCVTARSLRSMGGDNTTGAMSVVLGPRVTARVERELAAARAWVAETGFAEVTEDEAWDTTMVTEYGEEIFTYMRDLENRMMPNPYYMDNQAEIQWSMRSVLVDWVAQVHSRFALLPETLFLAINCIDRFLTVKVVSLAKLQLVGATAIYVAAKYEEINCPSVQEIAYMVDGSYTIEEILKAERFMLTMLKFELGWPGPMSFLRRISKADDYDVETRTLAKYFLEVTLMDERFVGCVPSFLAAGSHCLARMMLNKGDWGAAHVHFSQYTYSQLKHLMSTILICCESPRNHHGAIFEKYTDKRYKRASTFVEAEIAKGFDLPAVSRESFGNPSSTSFRRK